MMKETNYKREILSISKILKMQKWKVEKDKERYTLFGGPAAIVRIELLRPSLMRTQL